MPEDMGKTIRVSVTDLVVGQTVRSVIVSKELGIKALYSLEAKEIVAYLFDKSKGWDLEKSLAHVQSLKAIREVKEIHVDQEKEFQRLVVEYADDSSDAFEKSAGSSFILTEEIVGDKAEAGKAVFCPNCGWSGEADVKSECPECSSALKAKPSKKPRKKPGDENEEESDTSKEKSDEDKSVVGKVGEAPVVASKAVAPEKESGAALGTEVEKSSEQFEVMDIIKADKTKQNVYGVFLVPEKADTDGDVISVEDVEKVAHGFIVEYRDIDEMHQKQAMDAEIVESFIAWVDNLEYYGKVLKKGTWAGAIHVTDEKVWAKIEKGEYRGFSVRISGRREPIGGE